MSDTAPPVKDGPLGLDDYAIDRDTVAWINAASVDELRQRLNSLDYSWNMHGQEDERARAQINAINDRLDAVEPITPYDGPPGGEALQTRIVQALLLAEGAPSPSGLPSWQTNDHEDAEAIAATVVRALLTETAGGAS